MLLDLDKFYNSNYKDFVHKEALEEALKYVPEAFLKDVNTKAILSITFSVDDVGENPIYVTYLDKDNKEHIVKLRPNITEQLTEVLKRYPTKTEMQEALNELKATITNEYTIFVNSEVETLNNTINNINISLTQSIKDTLDEAKRYTDAKHEETLTAIEQGNAETLAASKDYTDTKNQETQVGLKNYTDAKHEEALTKIAEGDTETLAVAKDYTDNLKEELTPVIAENKNRLYIDNAGGEKNEIEKTGHVTFEVNDGIKAIEVKQNDTEELPAERIDFDDYAKKTDIPTNTVTTDYLTEQLGNYESKADASIDHDKLSEVPNGHKTPYISWYPDIDSNYIRMVDDNGEVRFHINNSQTLLETIGYLSSRNPANFTTTGDLEPLTSKLSNIWYSHKAPFIYWLPNIDINTIKLENTDNDVKVILNDSDVVYWRKNEYQPSGAELKVGFGTELPKTENSIVIRADSGDKTISGMYFTAEGDTASFNPDGYIKIIEAPKWRWAQYYPEKSPSTIELSDYYEGYIKMKIITRNSNNPNIREVDTYLPRSLPVTSSDVSALVQEETSTNVKNVAVSLQQKARTTREISNNSTFVETKDFYILNLDFSFVPNVLPASVENSFIENIVIDAPKFNGKRFNVTFKANEHTATSQGVVGEPLTIKTCAFPADETIKTIEVIVKDKIIIRKETE